jgi:NAD(P)H dehydrogenase (quinone)
LLLLLTSIRYYSTYGHVARLAEEIKKGADSVDGVEATIWQVAETLPKEALAKMHAPAKREEHPVMISGKQLADADGILFGFPARFGMMAAQMKALFDSTGGLWQTQALAGKPAGFFFALGTQGGGQEETALTVVSQLTHHGMVFVPVGYTFGEGMFDMDEVRCCSPYGAGTFAGKDGKSRLPSDAELQMAAHQGSYFAAFARKLKAGAGVVA